MQEQTFSLAELVERAKNIMAENGYRQKTVGNYSYVWNQLIAFAHSKEIRTFSEELLNSFALERYGITNALQPETDREKYYARILYCLYNAANCTPWITKNKSYRSLRARALQFQALEYAFNCFSNKLMSKNLKHKSIELKQQQLRDFLKYIESEGISEISELGVKIISDYLRAKDAFSTSTKSGILTTMREFFRTPEVLAQTQQDLSINLRAPNNGRYERLPSTYSTDEIRRLLSCIDRTTQDGKKDYAVIILAVDAGMRVSDIINLRIPNLNWLAGTIEIIQSKTGEHSSITMSDTIKFALLDYLMNVRPKNTAYDNLFLRSNAPIIPYISAGHYYKRLNKYIRAANINVNGRHHGMHAMRHSLATRLMSDDVSITVISEALGHKYANVTKGYVRIDINKLRLAALEVSSGV